MSPFQFFLYILALAFGLLSIGMAGLVLWFMLNLVKGWLMGEPTR